MAGKRASMNESRLRELIQEATVDSYNSLTDEHSGLMHMVEEHVICPFKAKVIGEEVEVVGFSDSKFGFGINAVCRRNGKDYSIGINSLEWPKKKPEGFEWIEAYQLWLTTVG